MAAPPPPMAQGPPAPILNFADRYRDARFDGDGDSYGRLLAQHDPMSPHSLLAARLRDSLLKESDDSSRAIVCHWQDPTRPDVPGRIVVLHGLQEFPFLAGRGTTFWDDKVFGWFEDMEDGAPPTIFQVPINDIFKLAEPSGGVTNLRVYDATTLTAMYLADPNLVVAPLPAVGDAG